jgi:hypothetical protein
MVMAKMKISAKWRRQRENNEKRQHQIMKSGVISNVKAYGNGVSVSGGEMA